MADTSPTFSRALLHPRFALTWLGFGVWWLCAQLPTRWQVRLGGALGRALWFTAPRRRAIAARNLELCLPHLDAAARKRLLREHFAALGTAVFETGAAWFWSAARLDRAYEVEGIEHLQAASAAGQGVILMAFHFTHIDIGAKLLGRSVTIDGFYRPHNNAVYNYIQHRGRERHTHGGRAIARGDLRVMVKALRAGRAVWYAPDQDYGRSPGVFVPFFGVLANTVTATTQLARLGRARVVPFVQTRVGSRYRLEVLAPLMEFPSGDDRADACAINALAERLILRQPAHYLWVHRRFKTRPPGEPSLY